MKLFCKGGAHAANGSKIHLNLPRLPYRAAWSAIGTREWKNERRAMAAFGAMLVYGTVIMGVMIHYSTSQSAALTAPFMEGEPKRVAVETQPMVLVAESLAYTCEATVDQNEVLALAVGIDAVISSVPNGELASDVTMVMVGSTIMNRVESGRYPNTVEEVLCQPMQFSCFSETGLKWVGRAADNDAFKARCMDAAERVLNGERMLSPQVLYVSADRQGAVEAQLDGLYFCR